MKVTHIKTKSGRNNETGFWQNDFFFSSWICFYDNFHSLLYSTKLVSCCFNELSNLPVITFSQMLSEGDSAAQFRKWLGYFE